MGNVLFVVGRHQMNTNIDITLIIVTFKKKCLNNVFLCLQLTDAGHDEYCYICEKQFAQFTKDLYPCRVCTRAFHRKCIESCKECSQTEKDTIDRRHTNTGWSCYLCVSKIC